jgi:hypothetical protein
MQTPPASGIVGALVTKSMTVPRHAKLELHGHQVELVQMLQLVPGI